MQRLASSSMEWVGLLTSSAAISTEAEHKKKRFGLISPRPSSASVDVACFSALARSFLITTGHSYALHKKIEHFRGRHFSHKRKTQALSGVWIKASLSWTALRI